MKLISFGVPSYNSESYIKKCIDSLLIGGNDVEIIIINDGSKDNTAVIADEYQTAYPSIVKVVHKENGGHGSGVNKALELASGLYYKVVDSDDWLDADGLKKLLDNIKQCQAENTLPDLYICNFIYEHVQDDTRHRVRYTRNFPKNKLFTWENAKSFQTARILLMHALIYKTTSLRASNTVLPEHTFYVDNIFAFKPLPFMQTLYYMDIDLYHYFIGRDDQSIKKNNFVTRYQQQINVMQAIIDSYYYNDIIALPYQLKKYMVHYIGTIMMNTLLFTVASDSPERRQKLKELWKHLKDRDIKLYRKIRYRSYPTIVSWMPWKLRGWIMVQGYKILCKFIKLG